MGYGIRYDYGMFAQRIVNGQQVEEPDGWLVNGNPWEFMRPEFSYAVRFGGRLTTENGRSTWLALDDDDLAEQCRNLEILTEGFPTYGGLAGRDLEALAQGLHRSACRRTYLRLPIRSTAYLGEALEAAGIPVVVPFGGHAIFIDARAMLPHIPPLEYPGQALACALYLEGGIRSCEIGTVMFGRQRDGTEDTRGDGPRTPGDPAADIHAEPHRLRDRGCALGGRARRRAPRNAHRRRTADASPLHGELRAHHSRLIHPGQVAVRRGATLLSNHDRRPPAGPPAAVVSKDPA